MKRKPTRLFLISFGAQLIFPEKKRSISSFRLSGSSFNETSRRIAITPLTPFLLSELKKDSLSSLWAYGGFPDGGIQRPKQFPDWQKNYLTLLVQRDLPLWGLSASPQIITRFLKMLAASHGQIWNASQLASSLGLSYHTVNRYLDYLQNAFVISLLPPYFKNIGKRLVKSPKIYWNDSGLLHSLLGVTLKNQLMNQPWVGASWEGFCISQILGTLRSVDKNLTLIILERATDTKLTFLF